MPLVVISITNNVMFKNVNVGILKVPAITNKVVFCFSVVLTVQLCSARKQMTFINNVIFSQEGHLPDTTKIT